MVGVAPPLWKADMQVQIVENWTDLSGDVVTWQPSSTLTGFGIAEVRVRGAAPVASFPNLLHDATGNTVRVYVPTAAAARLNLSPGARVRFRVRKGGPRAIFAHPEHVGNE